MEMAILKPSFALMLNSEGYSPVHLALQHKQYHTVRALVILDPQLIRVRGRGGITPLHFVARGKGDNEQENKELLELLAEFLYACKSSIEDLTSQCETDVHVAVKNHNLEAFEVLFGWLKRVHLTKILNWKDQDGNTVLHITASEEQKPEIIKLLIGYTNINAKNFQDKTALEIFQENRSGDQDVMKRLRHQKCRAKWFTPLSLSQFFRKELSVVEKYACCFGIQDDARDIILQVSTLIAIATYQAALTPPGGYWQEDSSNPLANFTIGPADSNGTAIGKPHKAGNMILNGSDLYLFTAFNSAVFLASIGTIWATAVTLMPDTFMVYCSMSSLVAAFLLTLMIEFPKGNRVGGLGLFYDCLAFVMLFLPIYFWMKHTRVRKQIDARGRLVGNF